MIRTYTELQNYDTLEERYAYLRLGGDIAEETFGFDRWMNQQFYRSREWRAIRLHVIVRDQGCDLGVDDFKIRKAPVIHHMNPITVEDIRESTDYLLDPEFLISTCLQTHNAIHYGSANLLPQPLVERKPGDTTPWRKDLL